MNPTPIAVKIWTVIWTVAVFAVLWASPVCAEDLVAIKAGRILTLSGKNKDNYKEIVSGVILVEDGRIIAVDEAKKVKIPWNAEVIDAGRHVVMPGMIMAHTSRGMRVTNEAMQTVPYLHVRDSISTVDTYFEEALRDGVIALGVMPGHYTLVGGQGMAVKPHGLTVEAMTVRECTGMKISLLPGRNASRMSHMQKLRRYFIDFQDEMARRAETRQAAEETAKAKGDTVDPETPLEVKKKPLQDLLDGRLTAFVYSPTASDVFKALELIETFKLKIVLILGTDCFKAVDAIARAGLPVILSPRMIHRERDPETRKEIETCPAVVFHKAGVPFALLPDTASLGGRHLWFQAAVAMRHGLPREAALKAITVTPAKLLGIEDRFGSIEVGKDANLVILTGDPLQYNTWVDRVLFEGKVIYDRKTDPKIRRLFKEKPPEKAAKPVKEKEPGSGKKSSEKSKKSEKSEKSEKNGKK